MCCCTKFPFAPHKRFFVSLPPPPPHHSPPLGIPFQGLIKPPLPPEFPIFENTPVETINPLLLEK